MRKLIVSMLIIIISFSSCGILFWRNVKCRDYELVSERFWFQGYLLTPYTFINKSSGEKKVFYLADKWISHRDNYYSDTGCDCADKSSQLLISGKDSLWILSESRYIEKNKPETIENYTFVIKGKKTMINSIFSSVLYDSITINGATHITKKIIRESDGVTVVVGELIGIISFNLGNEIWELVDLKVEKLAPIFDYRYMNNYCY